ncbi:glycosyltransferase family 2 protein [Bacillus sp. JJ1566]|uniref:glycosyltransferase family 2 protein n=1 Tax=Bacillus sp. JJ1566 TaxID=3122961 RepID=UPI002FFE3BB2
MINESELPKVSIITVSFNSVETIEKTIQSVINQTYSNVEYIIIDGGSTDGTVDVIKKYEDRITHWVSEPDNGIYDAMNKGIKLSNGKLIGIINSDDWYETNAVKNAVDVYNRMNNVVIYGMLRMIKNEKVQFIKGYTHETLSNQMIQHPTCFVPKDLYDKYGVFNLKYKISADFELMQRLKANNVSFEMIEKIQANFRLGGASTSIIGPLESLNIRYEYGYISRFNYLLRKLMTYILYNVKKYV